MICCTLFARPNSLAATVAMPIHLPERFAEALRKRCENWPSLRRVWLFGSRARGDHRERSDIDLAFEFDAGAAGWHDLLGWLEDDAPTLLFVDAVRLDRASERLRAEVAREGIVVYERAQPDAKNRELSSGLSASR